MRTADSFIKELDIVALLENKIVGSIMYTRAKILRDDESEKQVISFGPVSVLPEFQRQGIGTLLIEHTKKIATKLGYDAILIYGDPEYYSRVGFVPAEQYGIGSADNMYVAPLLALELIDGALSDCSGRFFEDAIYHVDAEAAKIFDKYFPNKEEASNLPSQDRFQLLQGMIKPRL
jgi:predicted N-acetyltransferase YhbS